jgi:hypothetical protein
MFILQKQIVRLMAGVKPRNSCKGLFKRSEILTLPCEYIFSLMKFTVNNQKHSQTNSAIHIVNTRHMNKLHRPTANLSCFWKSVHYAGIKVSNRLPSRLTNLINKKEQFIVALKRYLITHCFYSVDKFLMLKTIHNVYTEFSYPYTVYYKWVLQFIYCVLE